MKLCKKLIACLTIMVVPVILTDCNNLPEMFTSSGAEANNIRPDSAAPDITEEHLKAKSTPVPSEPDMLVSPTSELAGLIERYENKIIKDAKYELGLADMRIKWLNRKKNGYTRWGSQNWMKEPGYYKSLNTFELAEECFSQNIFYNEMSIHSKPIAGFESLRIFHNGFAELFKREDMWKGVLYLYNNLSSKLDLQADLLQIVSTCGHLDELRKLYGLSPLREQVKGEERIFLAANLRVLKKFKWYLENYDPERLGTGGSPGFFREPCSVAQVALMLAKQVDPQRYAKIEPAIISIRWTKKQKVQDLKDFLDLVITSLEGFVTKQDAKRFDEILLEAAPHTKNKSTIQKMNML